MGRKLIFILTLLLTVSFSFAQDKKVGIAVLPFKVISHNNSLNYLSKGIPDILITTLSQADGVNIVERDRINDIIKELEFNQNDIFDDKNAVKVGKLTGSRYIITGTLTVIGDQVRIDARIVNIETGKIVKGFGDTAASKTMIFNSIDRVSSKIANYLTGKTPIPTKKNAPKIDVCFLIDSTGSMDDEIDVVKNKIRQIMAQVSNGSPKPYVRYSIVDYKDEGDEYITRRMDFTSDISKIQNYLSSIDASGGGDFEESLLEGLHVSINKLRWDTANQTGKMIFLIADAPYQQRKNLNLNNLLTQASSKKIGIYPVACSGIDQHGVTVFKQISQQTNGKFAFLTYKQQYVTHSGKKKDIIVRGDTVYESEKSLAKSEWDDEDIDAHAVKRASSKDSEGKYKAEDHISDAETDKSGRRRGSIRKSGKLENNLDSILLKNIKEKGKQLGVKYKSNKKINQSVILENQGISLKIRINNPDILKAFIKAHKNNQSLWVALAVLADKKSPHGFLIQEDSILMFPNKTVPDLAKTTFSAISKQPLYYEKHGIMTPNRWFIQVKVKKFTGKK